MRNLMPCGVYRERGYRFFFFSREEPRMHVHIYCEHGEAKYWLTPEIELAVNYSLTPKDLRTVELIVREMYDDFVYAWYKHIPG